MGLCATKWPIMATLCSSPSYVDMRLCATKWPIMATLCSTPSYVDMGLCATKWPIMATHCSTPSCIYKKLCATGWSIITPLCSIQLCVKATHLCTSNITCTHLLPQESESSYVVKCMAFKTHCFKWMCNCENNWKECRQVQNHYHCCTNVEGMWKTTQTASKKSCFLSWYLSARTSQIENRSVTTWLQCLVI
jgi:hypothetical protein